MGELNDRNPILTSLGKKREVTGKNAKVFHRKTKL